MSKSLNKVFLMGNVGQDPEVQESRNGIVVSLSLATDESFKLNGVWQERTDWHSLVAFQRNAEIVRDYVQKGSKILVQGKIRTDSWDDQATGERKYRTKVIVLELTLLSFAQTRDQQATRYAGEAEASFPMQGQYAQEELTSADIPF
jgi:single-strand DNA-binding protein